MSSLKKINNPYEFSSSSSSPSRVDHHHHIDHTDESSKKRKHHHTETFTTYWLETNLIEIARRIYMKGLHKNDHTLSRSNDSSFPHSRYCKRSYELGERE